MVATMGLALGVGLVVLGALGVRHARAIARFEERLDAFGSTTDLSTVEPAAWNVQVTKVFAIALAGVGAFVVLLSVLE